MPKDHALLVIFLVQTPGSASSLFVHIPFRGPRATEPDAPHRQFFLPLSPFPTSLTAILHILANAPQHTYPPPPGVPPPAPPPATVQSGTAGGAQVENMWWDGMGNIRVGTFSHNLPS
ncbi:hypothetical protein SCLCIDRAFT_27628 [Scleroderma citrinum Foug A]|uniref:Uncharacterized protein n=1 Tax=Scleroderma citrinum Foug A TaxID=1036808 RepID=A0A0C3DSX7_9AGAM|nr:hypothetical protein SCLCIDRAFT_27628 [Scleroderma citrinum Foug A]